MQNPKMTKSPLLEKAGNFTFLTQSVSKLGMEIHIYNQHLKLDKLCLRYK